MSQDAGPIQDVLGDPYTVEYIPLTPDLGDAPARAALVRRRHPAPRGAMLYLHGYNDYFFHTELADRVAEAGWEVYALDLRRYGRALREGELACHVEDVEVYFEEVSEALRRIRARDGHARVWLNAHSTGGLVASRYAQVHPGAVDALLLNAPFLDSPGFPGKRLLELTTLALRRVAPQLRMEQRLFPYYGWSLLAPDGPDSPCCGEWRFDVAWKRPKGMHYTPGWLVATREAQALLAEGPPIREPMLVLTSERSHRGFRWSEHYKEADVVLDVVRLREVAADLGPHVEQQSLPGALHDVWLSRPAVREAAYDHMVGWLSAVFSD